MRRTSWIVRKLVILLTGLPGVLQGGDKPLDFRYRMEVLATDIPRPMELEVAPDGRIFFNEYAGRLRFVRPDDGQVITAGSLDPFTEQENGFLGFALDPNFDSNHWIYLFYSPKEFVGQRLSRFVMRGDELDLTSETPILEFAEQRRRCCHHAGSVEFAPDGCLLISTGDNTDPGADTRGYAPIDERPDHGPVDAQKSSANTHDLRGKILRVRPLPDGGYEIPEGNLFPQDGSAGRPEIFVMGCRNPWRMSVDQATGIVYWGDVGPDARQTTDRGTRGYDEINQARGPGNFGWPYFVGNNFPYANHDYATGENGDIFDPLHPFNESPNNTGARDLPPAQPAMIYWPYADSPEFPILGAGGRTACAGPVFHFRSDFATTNGFPDYYDNCLLFWDWQRPFIKWARFDDDHRLVGIEDFTASALLANEDRIPVLKGPDTPFLIQRPVDAEFGSDGRLYLLDYGKTWGSNPDARLIRISYLRGNLPPLARATAEPNVGAVPLKVSLNADNSRDPEGEPLHYSWRLHPGGKEFSVEAQPTLTLSTPGDHIVALTVTDGEGLTATTSLPLVVGNSRPIVEFVAPQDGDFFNPNESIRYEVRVRDKEDGDSDQEAEIMDSRVFVRTDFKSRLDEMEVIEPALSMMRSSDCFNCHALQQKVVGPALMEIAERYRDQPEASAQAVQRVIKGSTGVWGEVPMLPHSQHTEQEVEQMVQWILALEPKSDANDQRRGLFGEFSRPTVIDTRYAVIEASYRDLGETSVSALTGTAKIVLRTQKIEAELCDASTDLNHQRSALGSINHGATATFKRLNLSNTTQIRVRVSSGGPGGTFELRRDAVSGPLLAAFKVRNTGGWDDFIELAAPVLPLSERSDVVLVFKNPGKGGLMNLDWVRFE